MTRPEHTQNTPRTRPEHVQNTSRTRPEHGDRQKPTRRDPPRDSLRRWAAPGGSVGAERARER
eukprot:3721478-Pyramimonas_sp.AAC.1